MWRIFLASLLLVALISHFWWLAVILVGWYLLKFPGYELIVMGILMDAYYGAFAYYPLYSLVALLLVLLAENTKPLFLSYSTDR